MFPGATLKKPDRKAKKKKGGTASLKLEHKNIVNPVKTGPVYNGNLS